MSRVLVVLGLLLVVIGWSWSWITKLGLGRLPGDIAVEKEGFRLYVPLATSLLISLVLSALAYLWKRFGGPQS
jgi:hypothetical protein